MPRVLEDCLPCAASRAATVAATLRRDLRLRLIFITHPSQPKMQRRASRDDDQSITTPTTSQVPPLAKRALALLMLLAVLCKLSSCAGAQDDDRCSRYEFQSHTARPGWLQPSRAFSWLCQSCRPRILQPRLVCCSILLRSLDCARPRAQGVRWLGRRSGPRESSLEPGGTSG